MSWIMLDYQCPRGHRFESLEKRGDEPTYIDCAAICQGSVAEATRLSSGEILPPRSGELCGLVATVTLSAPMVGTNWGGDISRGKSDPRPEGVLDTRSLAEGMPIKEWKQKRKAYWRDKDRAEIKAKAG